MKLLMFTSPITLGKSSNIVIVNPRTVTMLKANSKLVKPSDPSRTIGQCKDYEENCGNTIKY
jgi:hypothetical protein